MSKREYMHQETNKISGEKIVSQYYVERWPKSNEILVCKCGWYGRIEEQDAGCSECGCCPDCGNEDLIWLKELQERIAELEAELEKHRWIPVTERLPENVATVFILTGEGSGGIGFYGDDGNDYGWDRLDGAINTNITHWKPIIGLSKT